jgi:hypothetical protein
VGNDLSNFVTNSLGGGSGITAGRNVGNIYSYVNIGNGSTIRAQGWLSNFQGATIGNDFGLQVTGGSLGAFRANVLGARPTISVRDNAGVISVPTIGTGGNVTVGGTLSTFNSSIVGDSLNLNVTGDLSYFNANTVGAGVKVFAGGNITNMYVQKSSLTDATITAGQGIGGIYLYQGGILGTSVITANGTAGIGTVSASGGGLSGTFGAPNGNITQLRANGDVNATIRSSGTLGSLTVSGGTAISPRKLSGLIDVRVVSSIYGLYTAMENLTVRASNSINGIQAQSMNNVILSAGSVGNVILSGDLTGSKILSGYDVGADGLFGTGDDAAFGAGATGNITYLKVGGNMSGSSIAANINPGADLKFGTADDTLLASTLGGAIGSIIITGSLTGSGVPAENYGIVSHGAIGGVWVGGSMLTLPWALGNIVVQPSWR